MKKQKLSGKLIFKKHSAVIQMSNRITAQQRKSFNALLHLAYSEVNSDLEKYTEIQDKNLLPIFSFELAKVKTLAGIGATDNLKLKKALKELTSIVIEYNLLKKDREEWGVFALLGSVLIKQGIIKFTLSPQIFNTLVKPNLFAPLDLTVLSGLESKYAIILYELIKDYAGAEIPRMDIETFRKLMGIEDAQYTNFYNLKKWVIDPAIIEINENAGMSLSYQSFTDKRKVIAIKFMMKENGKEKVINHLTPDRKEEEFDHFATTKSIYEKYIGKWTSRDTKYYQEDQNRFEQISMEAIEAGILSSYLRKSDNKIGSFHYCVGAIIEFSEHFPPGYLHYLRQKYEQQKTKTSK